MAPVMKPKAKGEAIVVKETSRGSRGDHAQFDRHDHLCTADRGGMP